VKIWNESYLSHKMIINITTMCDFIGYEIRDKHGMKNKIIEEEDWEAEPELEKVQEEQPITMTQ
jgi:hypothetical protein